MCLNISNTPIIREHISFRNIIHEIYTVTGNTIAMRNLNDNDK